MATFVLTVIFIIAGLILLFFAWAVSTDKGAACGRRLLMASAACFAMAASGVSDIARAQSGHAEHHDWYKELKTHSGWSCCSGDEEHGDCRPAQAHQRDDGLWEAFYAGDWHI